MIEALLMQHVQHGAAAACLRVHGADHDARDTGLHDRPGAHRAGLEGHIHRTVLDPPVLECPARLPDGDHLRMHQCTPILVSPVIAAPQDGARLDTERGRMLVRLARGIRPIINDDAPNGYIIVLQRLPGLPDRQIHIVFIALRACCRNRHCFHSVCSSFQIPVRPTLTMDLHIRLVLIFGNPASCISIA